MAGIHLPITKFLKLLLIGLVGKQPRMHDELILIVTFINRDSTILVKLTAKSPPIFPSFISDYSSRWKTSAFLLLANILSVLGHLVNNDRIT
jgi:hypothetical protein